MAFERESRVDPRLRLNRIQTHGFHAPTLEQRMADKELQIPVGHRGVIITPDGTRMELPAGTHVLRALTHLLEVKPMQSDERLTPQMLQEMLTFTTRLKPASGSDEERLTAMVTHMAGEIEQLWSDMDAQSKESSRGGKVDSESRP